MKETPPRRVGESILGMANSSTKGIVLHQAKECTPGMVNTYTRGIQLLRANVFILGMESISIKEAQHLQAIESTPSMGSICTRETVPPQVKHCTLLTHPFRRQSFWQPLPKVFQADCPQ